jgi:short-subunit dehydrogenase
MRIDGRIALVTGASRGIGRALALALGRSGASLALVARNHEQLDAVAEQIGRERALVVPADLADLEHVRGVVDATTARFGRIDVLVNNAGVVCGQDFLKTEVETVARTVDVNYRAAAVLTRLAAESMAARRFGHVVNISSLAGVVGVPGEATYSGTKAALRLFTASLRLELAEHHIGLTDVVLGFVTTDMLDQAETSPRVSRLFAQGRRLGLMVDTPPEVVAAAIVRAIERRQEVVVLPTRAQLLVMPLQGAARAISRVFAR